MHISICTRVCIRVFLKDHNIIAIIIMTYQQICMSPHTVYVHICMLCQVYRSKRTGLFDPRVIPGFRFSSLTIDYFQLNPPQHTFPNLMSTIINQQQLRNHCRFSTKYTQFELVLTLNNPLQKHTDSSLLYIEERNQLGEPWKNWYREAL